MKLHKIIGIDPGVSGGIAVISKGGLKTYKIPTIKKKIGKKEINTMCISDVTFILKEESKGKDVVVFIEKVQAWLSDEDDAGKRFAIQKMLANYEQLKTVLTILGLKVVEVTPQRWQKGLGFRNKGMLKAQRKKSYKTFAEKIHPDHKITLSTSDAVCVAEYGKLIVKQDPLWVEQNING